jgi:hypothetical protein
MIEQVTSTLSKRFKSQEQKKAAVDRNKANGKMRAELNAQKANTTNTGTRAEIQRKIDSIGAGKKVG